MRHTRFLQRTFALCLGFWLIAETMPRLIGHWHRIEAAGVQQRWSFGEPIRTLDIEYAAPFYEKAFSWFDNPSWRFELGGMHLSHGIDQVNLVGAEAAGSGDASEGAIVSPIETPFIPPIAKRSLRDAIDAYERGLRLSPVNGHAWYHLATSRFLLDPDDKLAVLALKHSLILAPGDASLILDRLNLAFRYWAQLSPEFRALLRPQYEYAVELDADQLSYLLAEADVFDEVSKSLSASSRSRLDSIDVSLP